MTHKFDTNVRYPNLDPEQRLEHLVSMHSMADGADKKSFFEGRIIELTIDMGEHPDWFNETGLCCSCESCCEDAG